MKTAISIPDAVFESAEQLARRLGMSRSELYVTAIKQFVEAHDQQDITARLDALYGTTDSSLDSVVMELQRQSLPSGDW